MAKYNQADQIMISNIQHMHVNGKESTIFDVYVKQGDVYVFDSQEVLRGTIKRESTIIRKITE